MPIPTGKYRFEKIPNTEEPIAPSFKEIEGKNWDRLERILISGTDIGSVSRLRENSNTQLSGLVTLLAGPNIALTTNLNKNAIEISGLDIGCRVYHSAAQSIPNATLTILNFNSERWDTDNMHDTVTNNSRITINTSGKYAIVAQCNFEPNTTGSRIIDILLTGTTLLAREQLLTNTTAASRWNGRAATIYHLVSGNYIEMRVYQDSGAAINVESDGNYTPEFVVQKIG